MIGFMVLLFDMKIGGTVREQVLRLLFGAVCLAAIYRAAEYVWTPSSVISVIETRVVGSSNDKESNSELVNEEQLEKLRKVERENAELKRVLTQMRIPDSRFTLRDKLAFVYPYVEDEKFPGYIWQIWKYGLRDENFGTRWKEYEAEWTILNPGFVHDLFNDDTSAAVVRYLYRNIPEIVEAYEKLPLQILRVDFFKYLILFAKGGVYADIDSVPLKPIPSWINENVDPSRVGMILGLENDGINEKFSRQLQFGNFIMQSKAGHPILREVIAIITERTLSGKMRIGEAIEVDLMEWTAGGVLTDTVLEYFRNYVTSEVYYEFDTHELSGLREGKLVGDVLVLPVESLGGRGGEEEEEGKAEKDGKEGKEGKDGKDGTEGREELAQHERGRLYMAGHAAAEGE